MHFEENELLILDKIEIELDKNPADYDLSLLWSYDATIGKIGAYSMPADPKRNPFPGGVARVIYRPLQYARAQMDIMDINMRPRNIIRDVGLHFEGLAKYILKKETRFKSVIYRKATLGKALHLLKKESIMDTNTFESCKKVIQIYNISKHNISMEEDKASSFVPMDAVIFYLVVRKIGNKLISPYFDELCREIGSDIERVLNYKSRII